MDPVAVLTHLGGAAALREFKGLVTRPELEAALAQGVIFRARRGFYSLTDVSADRQAAARARGVVSHLSAAEHYGWKVKWSAERTWVTVPSKSRRPVGVEVRWADLAEDEVADGVTSRIRTVIDCARTLPFDEALSVADSALREGVVGKHALLIAAQRSPRTGRSKALRVVELADGRRANPFESCLAVILMTVPDLEVVPQEWVPGVGRVDFWGAALGIVVEAESLEFHSSKESLQKDVDRYTNAARKGLTVVRFTWSDVMFGPDAVRDAMVDVVLWRRRQVVGGHAFAA